MIDLVLPDYRRTAHGAQLPYALPKGAVSMHLGYPNEDLFPVEILKSAIEDVIQNRSQSSLQYCATSGLEALRRLVIQPEHSGRHDLDLGNALITHGTSESIDLMADLFLIPGTPVLVSEPSYLWAIRAFRLRGALVHGVPMDSEGVIPSGVADAFDELKAKCQPPPFLYSMPSCHNPTGVTMPEHRRSELLEVCESRGLLVFEDDAYASLSYQGNPRSLFRDDSAGIVVHARTLSKLLAPGMRIGWVLGPSKVIEAVDRIKATGTCTLTSAIAAAALDNPLYESEVQRIREAYGRKMSLATRALRESCPESCSWDEPGGGFYIWVKCDCHEDSVAVCRRIADQGVLCAPGQYFFANGEPYTALRLSISHPSEHDIVQAIVRVCKVLRDTVE